MKEKRKVINDEILGQNYKENFETFLYQIKRKWQQNTATCSVCDLIRSRTFLYEKCEKKKGKIGYIILNI
jgi:hypothetical protein